MLSILVLSIGSIQFANASSPVIAVSECKPYERVETFGNFPFVIQSEYYTYRFKVKYCSYSQGVVVANKIFDLGIFEDNDNPYVSYNLLQRCKAAQEEAADSIVPVSQTDCAKRYRQKE